ncbi:hypothetical protein LCGC14_1946710, partial [marine sediment metagenome]
FRDLTGKSRLTQMTEPQLKTVLDAVRVARPRVIKGKRVVTPATEVKIQSLKESLIAENAMSEEHFNQMLKRLNLRTPRYENQYRFITEKEGKSVIRAMNDEAEIGYYKLLADWDVVLAKNPQVAGTVSEYQTRIAREGQVYFRGEKADASSLKDMRFFMEDLEVRTGKPFYQIYDPLNKQFLINRMMFTDLKRRQIQSTTEFRSIISSRKSLDRISNYIAAKNKWSSIESPKDITAGEIKLANELEASLFETVPSYRYNRFLNFYKLYEGDVKAIAREIPDAPKADLRIAVNIYESQGAGRLKAYLNTRTWGVIESGFEPHFVVNPRLAARSQKVLFPTGRFKTRSGVEFYPTDQNIVQRVDRYLQQVLSYNLRPYAREIEALYREAIPQLKNPEKIRQGLSMMLNEKMGYIERGGMLYDIIAKIASQAYITVFSTMPVLPFRNLFQNLAWHPDKSMLVNPLNRKLTEWDWRFYHTYVSQMEAIPRDLLLAQEGGLPGLNRFNRLILRVNIYGASDSKINRVWSYWASLNKAEVALKVYQKDGNIKKFIANSGMAELTLTQQVNILKTLHLPRVTSRLPGLSSVKGEYQAISEIALEITNNVHFLYDRSQRALIEMGGMGRILGSLVVFPRSTAQRILKQLGTLDPLSWAPGVKRRRAIKVLLSGAIGGMATGNLFQEITGRKYNPYNPLNILSWSPGGLALGSVTNLSDVVGDIFRSLQGDENAKQRLPGELERVGDTFLPFYKLIISSLEAVTDTQYLDRRVVGEVRAILEKKLQEMG